MKLDRLHNVVLDDIDWNSLHGDFILYYEWLDGEGVELWYLIDSNGDDVLGDVEGADEERLITRIYEDREYLKANERDYGSV